MSGAPLRPADAAAPPAPVGDAQPTTRRDLPHRGGPDHPSVAPLRAAFGDAIRRVEVVWGDTIVHVAAERIHDVIRWLRDAPAERYDYLVDVTAVEYREAGRPLEVVWHLRALAGRRFLRLKVELSPRGPLVVPSITDLYGAADWLERECFDMFGITFEGHPDLRRILLWESYREGHPLRKDFPLRGRFSRSEQLSQALAAQPEAPYSAEELRIADAFDQLPADMRERLAAGGRADAAHAADEGPAA